MGAFPNVLFVSCAWRSLSKWEFYYKKILSSMDFIKKFVSLSLLHSFNVLWYKVDLGSSKGDSKTQLPSLDSMKFLN
jgi:hypothetical protein